jgi:hypothetical protein
MKPMMAMKPSFVRRLGGRLVARGKEICIGVAKGTTQPDQVLPGKVFDSIGVPDRIRTCDPQIRNMRLYFASRFLKLPASAKSLDFIVD